MGEGKLGKTGQKQGALKGNGKMKSSGEAQENAKQKGPSVNRRVMKKGVKHESRQIVG